MALAIAEFVDSQTRGVERWSVPEAPDRARCKVVERIAPTSVASAAGVGVGDLVVAVDDEPAAAVTVGPAEELVATRRYLFYSDERSEHIRLESTGIDIGAVLCPTVEGIDTTYQRGGDLSCLYSVWRAGRWSTLEELARLEATGKRKRAGVVGRLFGRRPDPTPATLLLGAATYEQGRTREGLSLIEQYAEQHDRKWQQVYLGIALYYLGLAAEAAGDRDTAVDRLSLACTYCQFARIADRLQEMTGKRADLGQPSPWCGELFPFPYRLVPLGADSAPISLSATFATMPEDQLLAVCLLGEERATNEYRAFLLRFRNFVHFARPYLHGLHVITCAGPSEVVDQDLLGGEQLVHDEGVLFEVLHDADGRVHEALKPGPPPDVLLLTAAGQVYYRGALEAVDLWNVLAARYA